MFRPPFAARVVTGLIVTAIEETRKLPTTAVTLPMTAVSTTLQAAMRMQQNIAELAIKGDEALELLFHRSQEQPEWATFDEDVDDIVDPTLDPTARRAAGTGDTTSDTATVTPISAAGGRSTASRPATDSDARHPDPADAADSSAPVTPADMPETQADTVEPTPPPVAKKAAAKSPAKKAAPAKTAAAKKAAPTRTPAKKAAAPATDASGDDDATTTNKGRFALYSSAPDTVLRSDVESAPVAPATDAPEIVEYLDYDGLTLAQLRAKIRTVDLEDLRTLAEYERGHRGRAPFQTMLDNRITAASAK